MKKIFALFALLLCCLLYTSFWNVTHNFQVGVEYLHGWREDFNDLSREANRINLSAQYNF